MEAELTQWIAHFSYPAVFLLLIAGGVGAPVSEELILITAGLVVAHGHGHLWLMMLVAYLGTLGGDLALYRIGWKVGHRALTHPRLKRLLTPERVAWVTGHFDRNGLLTIFIARFLPGLRAATFLVAGVSRFRFRRFILADAAAALISAPLLTWLGFRFGVVVLRDVRSASKWILLGVVVLLVAVTARKVLRRRRRVEAGQPRIAARMLERNLGEGTR